MDSLGSDCVYLYRKSQRRRNSHQCLHPSCCVLHRGTPRHPSTCKRWHQGYSSDRTDRSPSHRPKPKVSMAEFSTPCTHESVPPASRGSPRRQSEPLELSNDQQIFEKLMWHPSSAGSSETSQQGQEQIRRYIHSTRLVSTTSETVKLAAR